MKRDTGLDILRGVGLLLIILAHVNPPALIFQLRNFDVPLMVLVSGIVFGISSGASKSYIEYFISRIRRLVFPTWIFLSIFFVIYILRTLLTGVSFPFSNSTILSSYLLITGIGYVWIIRVFLLVALAMPLLFKLKKNFRGSFYLIILLLIYLGYELLYYFYPANLIGSDFSIINFLFQNIIFYLLPYGVIAGLGLSISKMSKRNIGLLTLGFLVILISSSLINHFAFTQNFKYPPSLYYLVLRIFCFIVLFHC